MSELLAASPGVETTPQGAITPIGKAPDSPLKPLPTTNSWWLLGLIWSQAPAEQPAPQLKDTDFELVEWSEKNEIAFSFEKLKTELQAALSFVPFFQEETNLTPENVSWFIEEWNASNPDHTVDASEDPVQAIREIREHMIEIGEESFLEGVVLYALFSPKLTHIAKQILGHAPREDGYDQMMINWYGKFRA